MSEGYSLEKLRAAPEVTLTSEDEVFLAEWNERLENITRKGNEHPDAELRVLVTEMFKLNTWKLLFGMKEAERLNAKAHESKEGQMALGHEEALRMNEEYERRAAAIVKAIEEFMDYREEANGRK